MHVLWKKENHQPRDGHLIGLDKLPGSRELCHRIGCQMPQSPSCSHNCDSPILCPVPSLLSSNGHLSFPWSGSWGNVCALGSKSSATTADRFSIGQMSIDIPPDDALLEIFSFYLVEAPEDRETWLSLVHVCRRWRSTVFASPRRLNVRVFYTPKRQVNVMLDLWPNLPIVKASTGLDSTTCTKSELVAST